MYLVVKNAFFATKYNNNSTGWICHGVCYTRSV